MRRAVTNSRGMTLVEILVAVSILSIAVIVLASLFPVAINYQQKATYTRIAALDAMGTLDGAMVAGFDNLDLGSTTSTTADLPAGNTKTITVQAYPTSDCTSLKLVTVRISWPGTAKVKYLAGEVVYRTLIAKPYKEGSEIHADI